MHRKLTETPARSLSSREIANIISGLLGSLAGWNNPDDIIAAIDHIAEHRDNYKRMFAHIRNQDQEEIRRKIFEASKGD